MKSIISSILLVYSIISYSQNTFERIYDGKTIYSNVSVSEEQDDGFIMCVSDQDPIWLDYNIKVIKVNVNGDTIWTNTYGTNSVNEYGSYIEPTADGGYILCGTKVIKIDSSGNEEWEKSYSYPSEFIYKILETNYSEYIFLARGTSNSFLSKTNNLGEVIWTKLFNYNLFDLQILSNGNYILAGSKDTSSYAENTLILLTDTSGNEIWHREYDLDYLDRAYSIIEMNNSNLAVCGMRDFADTAPFDSFVILLDSNGDTIFTRSYGLPGFTGDERAYSICESTDSGFIFTGEDNGGTFIIKIDSVGNEIWNNNLIGIKGTCILKTFDDNYVISGVYNSDNVFLVKTDNLGVVSIDDKNSGPQVNIFPNPSIGKIIFEPENFDSVEIIDNIGEVKLSTSDNNIDISNLSNGMYIVRVKYGKKIIVKKIIKQ